MKRLFQRMLALTLCLALSAGCVLGLGGCASRGVSDQPAQSGPAVQDETPQPQQPEPEEILPLECDPLTGAQPDENAEAGLRPVAVMLDNSSAALPHSGIASASVVYEMVTEGGIPRMMAVFPGTHAIPGKLGPVRSTRDQFLQLLIPENMILLHIGASVYAHDLLNTIQYPTVDGIYLGTIVFGFDDVRAATRDNSHCFYTNNELAAAGIAHEKISPTGTVDALFRFVPYDKEPVVPTAPAANVEFAFSPVADVSFAYNTDAARYYKTEYGNPQMDEATGEQVSYTNLLLLSCPVSLKADGLVSHFDFTAGEGFYLTQGGMQKVTWTKGVVEEPLSVYDETGEELAVNVGTSYIAFVDERVLAATLKVDGASPYTAAE